MAEGKKKKATRTVKRTRRRLGRRELIRTLAVGAGGAVLASSAMGGEDPEPDLNGQYVVWPTPNVEVAYGYPITGFTQDGLWIVDFGPDDPETHWLGGLWVIDPSGYLYDSGFYNIMNEFADGGVYYEGGHGDDLYFHENGLEFVNVLTDTA